MKNYVVTLDKKVIKAVKNRITINPTCDFTALIPAVDEITYNRYYALFASYASILQAHYNNIKPLEYLRLYVIWKLQEYTFNNDYGAYGDIIEVLTRCILRKRINFIRLTDIQVKPLTSKNDTLRQQISFTDAKSKGMFFEVGHNGKTLTEGTITDFMEGNYNGFIYGMFMQEELTAICNYIINNDYKKAFKAIASGLYVWVNKYDFITDINSVSRGKGITYKPHINAPQIVFNQSKLNAFIQYMEISNIPTLFEFASDSELLK